MTATRYVNLDAETVDAHHLCCGLGDRKHVEGVDRKKAWLKARFAQGLVFRKLDVRGKVFIEYAPSERAFRPILAKNWLVIHCLWVSGQYAGKGHARALLEYCIADARAQGKAGVAVASAKTKRPFLSDRKFFEQFGFEVVDTAGEFLLLALRLKDTAQLPRFADAVKSQGPSTKGVFLARYTDQCPYNAHWAGEMVAELERCGRRAKAVRVTTLREAQNVKSPLGTFGLECDGELVTHHLNTAGAVQRLLEKRDACSQRAR